MPRPVQPNRAQNRGRFGFSTPLFLEPPHLGGGACAAPLFAELLAVSAGEGSLQPRCPRKGWVLTGSSRPIAILTPCSREDL